MSTYAYDFVKKLSFIRQAGTPEAKKAAKVIMDEIASLGGTSVYEPFKFPACHFNKYSVKVLSPYEKEIDVRPYGRSPSLPKGGVDLKLFYAEEGNPEDFCGIDDLSDTVVMLNNLSVEAYKILCEKHAAAFMVVWNKHYQNKDNWDFIHIPLKDKMFVYGKIPGFMIWSHDATEMVCANVSKLHLELETEDYEADGGNVVATIPGTEITDESIVVTAHYDSVNMGPGAFDNASGCGVIMQVYRHFLKNLPRRTMHFVWCDAEELGCLGSKAYVEQHEDLIKDQIKCCFNFDACGIAIGRSHVKLTGNEELFNFAKEFCKEMGHRAIISSGRQASDSTSFAVKDIPGINLFRRSATADFHHRYDGMFPLSAAQLKKEGDFAAAFMSRVISPDVIPVSKGMSEDIRKEIDRYRGVTK